MTLYDRIKKIADEKNMSISYIEENAQISNGSIAKWKQNTPKSDNLYRVAKLLGCSIEFLISGEISDNNTMDLENSYMIKESIIDYKLFLNENEIDLLNILKKFTDNRSQIKFVARAEALAEEMLNNIAENKK